MIKKPVFGDNVKERLIAAAKNRLHHFMIAEGAVRGAVLNGNLMIREMQANHELGVLETLVLGHAYLGAGLMTVNLKGHDRLTLKIDCSGPVKGLTVESNAYGEVRGFLKHPQIPVSAPVADFNVSSALGAGFLTVIRCLENAKQPFSGTVMLEHGTIAKDLARYFIISEQIPTAFHLSILFDRQGLVCGAGGLFLQAMPGASDDIMQTLEQAIRRMPSLGNVFHDDIQPDDFIQRHFVSFQPVFLDQRRIEFICHCSAQKISSMLTLLPQPDLVDLRDNGPFPLEIKCHHCNTPYYFNKNELADIYQTRFPRN